MIIPLSKWRCYKRKTISEKDYENSVLDKPDLMYVVRISIR